MHLAKGGGELIKILHVLLKSGFQGLRGFCNAFVKFLKTLGKHISLNIYEREEKKKMKIKSKTLP